MTDYKRKKKRKRRFLYADQAFLHGQERRFNTMLKRRSCITGITYSISLNINTMQHTHALTSTPNTDHPVFNEIANLTTTVSE